MGDESDPRILGDRRKALEDQFFAKEEQRKIEELRAREVRTATRAELREVSGIEEEAVLERLAELGVTGGSIAALCLIPLVEVAWANGRVEEREKQALLTAAADVGIDQRHPSYALLERWLIHRPDSGMFEAWGEYVRGLCRSLDAAGKRSFKEGILGRARQVAAAAGGFLGMAKISPEEEAMLGVLERTFED